MGFISVVLSFLGYVLVYASAANRGRFAARPWAGVTNDAYDAENLGAPVSMDPGEAVRTGQAFPIPGIPKTLPKNRNPIDNTTPDSKGVIPGTAKPPRPRGGGVGGAVGGTL